MSDFKLEPPTEDNGRRTLDYYPTPHWVTDILIEHYPPPTRLIVEPSAGDGAIIQRFNDRQHHDPSMNYQWWAIEIQKKFLKDLAKLKPTPVISIDDFFAQRKMLYRCCADSPTSIVGNPPYELALEFCRMCLRCGADYVAMLLRLDFLGSKKRKNFINAWPITQLIVLSKRPAFKKGSGTDMYNYSWVVWHRGAQAKSPISV